MSVSCIIRAVVVTLFNAISARQQEAKAEQEKQAAVIAERKRSLTEKTDGPSSHCSSPVRPVQPLFVCLVNKLSSAGFLSLLKEKAGLAASLCGWLFPTHKCCHLAIPLPELVCSRRGQEPLPILLLPPERPIQPPKKM